MLKIITLFIFLLNSTVIFPNEIDEIIKKNNSLEELTNFLNQMPVCELFKFTSNGQFGMLYKPLEEYRINVDANYVEPESFRSTDSEDYLYIQNCLEPYAELYNDNFRSESLFPKDPNYESSLEQLINTVFTEEFRGNTFRDFFSISDTLYQRKLSESDIGGCVLLSNTHTQQISLSSHPLSNEAQRNLTQLFTRPYSTRGEDITEIGFTTQEFGELQAIKSATQLFEENTPYGNDRGGWRGNLSTAFVKQTKCYDEALTYSYFLRSLENQGLLQHFDALDTIATRSHLGKFDHHEAALIRSKRTGELFVIDSWKDPGGSPARIYRFEEWEDKGDEMQLQIPTSN